MDEQTRYRATGSLFLLAIAIICLPMIFDGEGLAPVEIEPLALAEESPVVQKIQEIAPASDVVARVDELRSQVDNEGFLTSDGSKFAEPVLSDPDENTAVWAVQVASLQNVDNARKLRSDLRERGYEAFISTVKSDDEIMSRVAIGPLLSEANALEMLQKLSRAMSLEGRLMAFSN
jgi:DedD protein